MEWALSRHLPEGEAVEVTGVPTALNRMLRAGEIDVANCSSIEYAAAPERYVLLPSLCVGSDGAVDSVQLITDLPLERVRTVAATSQSATSATLCRVLLPDATLVAEDAAADARLLIGDDALRSALEDPTRHYDLGELWRERTGRPMVFAVWAARAEIAPSASRPSTTRCARPSPRPPRTRGRSRSTHPSASAFPPATSRATSTGCATASARASAPASSSSTRWPPRSASSSPPRRCASPTPRSPYPEDQMAVDVAHRTVSEILARTLDGERLSDADARDAAALARPRLGRHGC